MSNRVTLNKHHTDLLRAGVGSMLFLGLGVSEAFKNWIEAGTSMDDQGNLDEEISQDVAAFFMVAACAYQAGIDSGNITGSPHTSADFEYIGSVFGPIAQKGD